MRRVAPDQDTISKSIMVRNMHGMSLLMRNMHSILLVVFPDSLLVRLFSYSRVVTISPEYIMVCEFKFLVRDRRYQISLCSLVHVDRDTF